MIRNRVTYPLAACAAAAIAGTAQAADISLSASLSRNAVALNEQVVLQVSVSGASMNLPKPELPPLPEFTVRSAGQSRSVSITGFKAASTVSFEYVLLPRKTGTFTIPPIAVRDGGTVYRTAPLPIEVTKARTPPAGTAAAGHAEAGDDLAFVTASVDDRSPFVGQKTAYRFRFYTRTPVVSAPQYTPPDFTGFFAEAGPQRTFTETVGGKLYTVTELTSYLYPLRPGSYRLGRAGIQCAVQDLGRRSFFDDDFFANFFGSGKTLSLAAKPVSVTVRPLPDGRPEGFGGAVGDYRISASLDRGTVPAGEPVTLAVRVTGAGNLRTLAAPGLPPLPGFRKYGTTGAYDRDAGARVFRTMLVPETPGTRTVPAITLHFFDPAAEEYRTAATEPLSLEVTPGRPGAVPPPAEAGAGGGVQVKATDIRHIKTDDGVLRETARPLYLRRWFLLLNLAPLALLVTGAAFAARRARLSADRAYARRTRASSTARRYLKQARALLKENGREADCCAAVSRAVRRYVADTADVSAEGLTVTRIGEILSRRTADGELFAAVKSLLEECDQVRYAPARVTPESTETIYRGAEALIARLEKALR